MTDMIERGAAAIEEVLMARGLPRWTREIRSELSRAIIEVMREATPAMIVAVLQTSARDVPAERIWQAMINAALNEPTKE